MCLVRNACSVKSESISIYVSGSAKIISCAALPMWLPVDHCSTRPPPSQHMARDNQWRFEREGNAGECGADWWGITWMIAILLKGGERRRCA